MSILVTVLARSGRRDGLPPLWAGVGAAIVGATALGALLTTVNVTPVATVAEVAVWLAYAAGVSVLFLRSTRTPAPATA